MKQVLELLVDGEERERAFNPFNQGEGEREKRGGGKEEGRRRGRRAERKVEEEERVVERRE